MLSLFSIPRGGMPCYLSCTHTRLLTHFTTAGLGVNRNFILDNPPEDPDNRPFCLWIIAPNINSQNYTFRNLNVTSESESSFPPGFANTDTLFDKNDSFNQFTMSLKFNSSLTASSACFAESVLIYNGLPNFLQFSSPYSFFNFINNTSSINTNNSNFNENNNSNFTNGLYYETHSTINSFFDGGLNIGANLIASYTGEQLIDSSLSVTTSILTVVYLYNGMSILDLDSSPIGFNLTIHVEEWGNEMNESLNGNLTTSHNHYGLSLTGTNMTDCMGRYWHSSVFDPSTDSLWLYGGLDLSGVVCTGVLVLNVSRLMVAMEIGYEGSVRMVAPSDDREWPGSRHLHSAVHLPVSSCPCIDVLYNDADRLHITCINM